MFYLYFWGFQQLGACGEVAGGRRFPRKKRRGEGGEKGEKGEGRKGGKKREKEGKRREEKKEEGKEKIKEKGVSEVEIEITFDPPWQPSDELREMMGV